MIADLSLVLSDAQAVTASAASTNVVDSLAAGRAMTGNARVQFLVDTLPVSAGSSTCVFSLQDSADNSTFADVIVSPAIAKATLVAGYVPFEAMIPAGIRRYIRGFYTVAVADFSAGKFDCRIVLDTDRTLDKSL